MNDNIKISFDFDSTLDREDVQVFAKKCVEKAVEVYIVTSRQSTERALEMGHHWVKRQNEQLYEVAATVGIPVERIIFTEHIDKIEYLKDKNFIFHLDDDMDELTLITESGDKCKPIYVENDTWLEECRKALNLAILNKIAKPSDFLEKAQWRKDNRYWIDPCNKIQIKILQGLDDINSDLDTMCEQLNIDRKCCSGPYDFKLSELMRMSKYLKVDLLDKTNYLYYKK